MPDRSGVGMADIFAVFLDVRNQEYLRIVLVREVRHEDFFDTAEPRGEFDELRLGYILIAQTEDRVLVEQRLDLGEGVIVQTFRNVGTQNFGADDGVGDYRVISCGAGQNGASPWIVVRCMWRIYLGSSSRVRSAICKTQRLSQKVRSLDCHLWR